MPYVIPAWDARATRRHLRAPSAGTCLPVYIPEISIYVKIEEGGGALAPSTHILKDSMSSEASSSEKRSRSFWMYTPFYIDEISSALIRWYSLRSLPDEEEILYTDLFEMFDRPPDEDEYRLRYQGLVLGAARWTYRPHFRWIAYHQCSWTTRRNSQSLLPAPSSVSAPFCLQ